MPYKELLRTHGKTRKKKASYQVINWPEYNQSLKNRGSLTVWICEDIKDKWYAIKSSPPRKGRPFYYSDYTITIMLTLRIVFKQRLRQIQAFVSSLFALMSFYLDVPDYTRLSRRGSVPVLTRQLDKMNEPGHLVIDSTGIKVFGESEWLESKYGKQYKRKVWRKLHLGINKDGLIVSRVMTDHLTDDRSCLPDHLQQSDSTKVTEVIADTGYDGHETYTQLESAKIKPIIPPA